MSQRACLAVELSLASLALLYSLSQATWPEDMALAIIFAGMALLVDRGRVSFPHYGFLSAGPVLVLTGASVAGVDPGFQAVALLGVYLARWQLCADLLPAAFTLAFSVAVSQARPATGLAYLLLAFLHPLWRSRVFPQLPGSFVYRSWPFFLGTAAVIAAGSQLTGALAVLILSSLSIALTGLIRGGGVGLDVERAYEAESQRFRADKMKESLLLLDALAYSLHEQALPERVMTEVSDAMCRIAKADTFVLVERDGPRWRIIKERGVERPVANQGIQAAIKPTGIPAKGMVRLKRGWAGEAHAVLLTWEDEATLYLGRQAAPLESLPLLERLARLGAAALRTAHEKSQRLALGQHGEQLEALYAELRQAHQALETSQSDLVRVKKLAAVGQLAAGVAHEINNPLLAISVHLDLLRGALSDEEDLDSAATIELAVERCRVIVSQLLAFSRRPSSPPEVLKVSDCCREAMTMAGLSLPLSGPVGLTVRGHRHELVSILTNLLSNARDAVTASPDQPGVSLATESLGDKVVVSVEDRGCGIPAEIQERVFEPFFTTKEVGSGTGLGLYMAYTYAINAGGDLSFVSGPQGTTFRLTLPSAGS